MKLHKLAALTLAALSVSFGAYAQVAGSTQLGVEVTELRAVALGLSAKRQVLDKAVFNDNQPPQRIGTVGDVVIAPDKAVSYAIIDVGGFLGKGKGMGKHPVAIPVNQLKLEGGKFVLPGATKDAVKAMPRFEYAR